MTTPTPADEPGARPSLTRAPASSPSTLPEPDPVRMLASLEPARKMGARVGGMTKPRARTPERPASLSTHAATAPASPGRAWMIAGLLLAVVAIGGAYVGVIGGQAMQPGTLAEATIDPQVNPVVAALTQPSAPVAAKIETLPAKASSPDATALVASAPSATAAAIDRDELSPFNTLNAEPAGVAGSDGNSPATKPRADKKAIPLPGKTVVTALAAAASSPAEEEQPKAASPQKTVDASLTPAQRRKAAQAGDSALLKALVHHVSAHSKEEVKGVMPPLRVKGSKAPLTTIAQIVNHCRSLEGEEAKVCKVRICENYWGKDDACSTRPDFHRFETSAR